MMKRMLFPALAALVLALCLTACRDEIDLEGLVVEVQTDEAGDPTAFVVEDRQGERTGVRLAEGTRLWPRGSGSWTDEELRAAIRADLRTDAWAYASCHPRREELETADGTVKAYWATSAGISGELKREAAVLRDGTAVDVLELDRWGSWRYRLADGTELLEVEEPRGPENVQVMGVEGFESLSGAAQEKVRAWYEERGELYDEAEELERCYAAWKELGEEFQSDHIWQNVSPAASSERVMYFTTELMLPIDYGAGEYRASTFQTAFDRETGEEIDPWDLFAAPDAEVRRRLPELVAWDIAPSLREKMAEALEPEWIRFTSSGLDICFPTGSLPGREIFSDEGSEGELRVTEYCVDIDWRNIPEGFVQPWAVPDSWGEETP